MPTTKTQSVRPDLSITITESGEGRTVLILHGGGGPFTVAPIADHFSGSMHTLMPINPGWNGTPRPEGYDSVDDIAVSYLELLRIFDLRDVLVVGSSLGGWIGAEMAVNDSAGIISGLVVIDGAGIEVADAPIRDFFELDARGVAEHSFHDAERFYRDPATIPAEQAAIQAANMSTMRVYAGDPYMHNPSLIGRLAGVRVPTLVLWGESDRIFTPAYGRAYANALGNARFELIANAGHLPQIEQPAATFALLDDFVAR